jgi:probable phosphoglycerate mutase
MRSESTLYLVRHGQTVYNVEGRLQGWCDSPLTEAGVAGVRATAERLAGRSFVAAYVSPSPRTRATAELLLGHHRRVPVREMPDLREFGFGREEGRREVDLLPEVDPYEMWVGVVDGTFAGFPGGETGERYRARVLRAFRLIEASHPQGEVLVVSHCLTLMTYLSSIDPERTAPPRNAGVAVVETGPVRRLVSVEAREDEPTAVPAAG